MTLDLSRRSFLRAAGLTSAASLATTIVPFEALLAQASPLAADDTLLVSIYLGGGLDGAHLVVPTGASHYGHYVDRRAQLAVPLARTRPLSSEASLHTALPQLHSRYLGGKVAFVRGVDLLSTSSFDRLSHFDKTDYVMMGRNAPSGQPAGVWSRWAQTQPDNPMLCAAVEFGLPLLLQGGGRLQATGLPASLDGALGTGSSSEETALIAALDSVAAAYGDQPGLAAALARSGSAVPKLTRTLNDAYPAAVADDDEITRNLRVIASLINANLTGTRIYATVHGGYDTHENQLYDLEEKLFPQLDTALQTFFTSLTNPAQVIVMVWTEFGRRPEANQSGTDHGTANNVMLIGDRVGGGIYGSQPSFETTKLDADGNLVGSVPFGSIYAELIEEFLGGDADEILGQHYEPVGWLT